MMGKKQWLIGLVVVPLLVTVVVATIALASLTESGLTLTTEVDPPEMTSADRDAGLVPQTRAR